MADYASVCKRRALEASDCDCSSRRQITNCAVMVTCCMHWLRESSVQCAYSTGSCQQSSVLSVLTCTCCNCVMTVDMHV